MEIVSCPAPTTPGQSPPTPIFMPFSKLQGASTIAKGAPTNGEPHEQFFFIRRAIGRIFGTTVLCERALQALYENYSPSHARTLDKAQPIKQAGFCQGLSCVDHIQTAILSALLDQEGVRQGDTVSPKLFTAALQWMMKWIRKREVYELIGDSSRTFVLRTTVLFSKNITEAETMLKELNQNAFCEDQKMELEGSPIAETSSYVYLGRSKNVENDLKEELNRRQSSLGRLRAPKGSHRPAEGPKVPSPPVLPSLCYPAETCPNSVATSKALRTTHRALKRRLLKYNRRTQHLVGLRSSDMKSMSCLRDPAEYASKARHRWAGHIMRRTNDRWTLKALEWIPHEAKRPRGRPPTRRLTCSLHGWTS
ncbi:unnamed protein product [Strongylus vulgaris]|uniref:Reverse transcriptase domain-containing protein n=1 Tax=Strongylus vulgaris TaxID=40348 RepID=A0A3P7IYT7_STRVU|nr:unnamed protein product [Strongylus vulgaris]